MSNEEEQKLVDLGSEDSFPASDSPSYMGGIAVPGGPPKTRVARERVSTELVDPDQAGPDVPPRTVLGSTGKGEQIS